MERRELGPVFSLARKEGKWEQASALFDQMREKGLMLDITYMATVSLEKKRIVRTLLLALASLRSYLDAPT